MVKCFLLFVALALFLVSFAAALTTDGLSLLALKSAVNEDPTDALAGWIDSDASPCGWNGVSCDGGRVTGVSLTGRALAGYIPSELSLLEEIQTIQLDGNRFAGPIPAALAELKNLVTLDLAQNNLSGPIPPEIGGLGNLAHLDLSSNHLYGTLPATIAALPRLSGVLNLSCNLLYGPIPPAYGDIPVAVSLDLRRNNLSGEIPQVGSLLNQGPTAFAGNPNLCGFPLKNSCPGAKQEPNLPDSNRNSNASYAAARPIAVEEGRRRSAATIPILAGVVVAAVLSIFVLQWHFRRRCAPGVDEEAKKENDGAFAAAFTVSEERRDGRSSEIFAAVDEGFNLELEELLRASAYVVGKSRSGIVYKVVVGRGAAVAVRRLSEADDTEGSVAGGDEWRRRRAFESEAIAISRAKHPNVVRLLAYYYAPDERLLVYDYIPNGTLYSALHGAALNPNAPVLTWGSRLSIIQGAARGLAYLHELSPRKYAHGSIKSSKILLDDDLQSYISGFGVSRLIAGGAQKLNHSSSKKLFAATAQLAAAGSRVGGVSANAGYLAPEGRVPGGAVTQKGDVYSFGIVILEVVTGRVAEADLEPWVRRAFKEERPLSEVVDPALLHEVHAKKEVLAAFHVALGCSESDPELRPRMRTVAESLDRIGLGR